MRNKKLTRVMALAALTTLATTTMMSGTLAKYTSTLSATTDVDGDDSDQTNAVPIAKWAFNINGTEVDLLRDDGFYAKYSEDEDEVISFGLFDTIYDTVLDEDDGYVSDLQVANGKIAPGTMGGFALDADDGIGEVAFTIENKSDVDATFKLTLSMDADSWGYDVDSWNEISTLPIEFSIDGGTTWGDFVMTYEDVNGDSTDAESPDTTDDVFTMTLEGILQFDGSTATYDDEALKTLFGTNYSNIIVDGGLSSLGITEAVGGVTENNDATDIGLMWRWKFEQEDASGDVLTGDALIAADLIDTMIGIAAAEVGYDTTESDYGDIILPMTAELVFTQID